MLLDVTQASSISGAKLEDDDGLSAIEDVGANPRL